MLVFSRKEEQDYAMSNLLNELIMKETVYEIRRIVFLCLLTTATSVSAQEILTDSITGKTHEIPNVTVKARRTPPAVTATAPLQVMQKADMERIGVYEVADAVKHFSGVSVKDYGGIGGLKTVSVRSLGAQHTGVSYDGVFISDCQSGQVDISRFSLSNVSQLTMTIGQTDDIFQSARAFASAGTLNIQTAAPDFSDGPTHLTAGLKAGSFGLLNPTLLFNQKLGNKTAISAYGDFLRADGNYPFKMWNDNQLIDSKRNNSDIQSYRAEINLQTAFTPKQDLQIKAYLYDSERGLPGGVIYDNPYSAERLYDKNYFGQFRYENRFSQQVKLQVAGKFNYSWNRDYNNESSGITDDRFRQTETYLTATAWYSPVKGLAFSLAEDFSYNYLSTTLEDCQYPQRYTLLSVAAARYTHQRFSATASILHTFITENVRLGTAAADRKRWSPAISLSWKPFENQGIRLRASYKDIFRTPTFNDLYYLVIGNTKLKPETTKQANLGITWSQSGIAFFDFLSFSADTYYNRVNDKIVAVPTMFVWKMMNVGKVETIGLDLNVHAEYSINDRLKCYLSGSYNFMQAEDITNKESKTWRNQIIYTPKHSGNGSFTFETPWVNVTYNLLFASERYTLAQNLPDYRIKPYTDHGISISRSFKWNKHQLRIQADALNLSNKNYEIIRFYPMPGRNYKLSLTYNY